MKIKNFEEIDAWQNARKLTKEIYKLSNQSDFAKDWTLKDQIRRASISIMSNIAEGFDSGFKGEFIRFLIIAKRSVSEAQSQLYVALDQSYILKLEFDILYDQLLTIRKQISGFIRYLKSISN